MASSKLQVLEVSYRNEKWKSTLQLYGANIQNQEIRDDFGFSLRGSHTGERTSADVMIISFINCSMLKIPQTLINAYPSARYLEVKNCKLKSLERRDLSPYSKFLGLMIVENDIAFLPRDLFSDVKNVQELWLYNNKTHLIDPNILDGLDNLKVFDVSRNICIDKRFDETYRKGNASLEQIKEKLTTSFQSSSWQSVIQRNRRLESEIDVLEKVIDSKAGMYEHSLMELSAEIYELKLERSFYHVILQDLYKVFKNSEFKDFCINIDGEQFKVHKLMLAARSPVFFKMIRSNIHAEEVNLIDIDKATFRHIQDFIYTDEVPTSSEIDFMQLYISASHLKLEKLQHFAAMELVKRVNADNAFQILALSNKYHSKVLQERAFDEIKIQLEGIKIDDNLAEDVETLMKIFEAKMTINELVKK